MKAILHKIVIKLLELPFATIKMLGSTMIIFYLPKGVSANNIRITINDEASKQPVVADSKVNSVLDLDYGENEKPILIADIMYCKKYGNDIEVVIFNRRSVYIRLSIETMEKLLPPKQFHKIKNNCIVSFAYIVSVDGGCRGCTNMIDKSQHLNSRELKPAFKEARKQYNTF